VTAETTKFHLSATLYRGPPMQEIERNSRTGVIAKGRMATPAKEEIMLRGMAETESI
jgi:hypothetical protein